MSNLSIRKKYPNLDFEKLAKEYSLPLTDVYYFGLKGYGVKDIESRTGRPTFHIWDKHFLASMTFPISNDNSPFEITGKKLLFLGEEIPLDYRFVYRMAEGPPSHYYLRGSPSLTPTIDDELHINLDINHICQGCDFCGNIRNPNRFENITSNEAFDRIEKEIANPYYEKIKGMALVTGLFKTADDLVNEIIKLSKTMVKLNVGKLLFYIGFQIDPKRARIISNILHEQGIKFRYSYTIECFTDRQRIMHGIKGRKSMEEIFSTLESLNKCSIELLEYNYIPGLDMLKEFKTWASKLKDLAIPHISIFRPFFPEQRKICSNDFKKDPLMYLIEMRKIYDEMYPPIYGNQLANLWTFPSDHLYKPYLTEKDNRKLIKKVLEDNPIWSQYTTKKILPYAKLD